MSVNIFKFDEIIIIQDSKIYFTKKRKQVRFRQKIAKDQMVT